MLTLVSVSAGGEARPLKLSLEQVPAVIFKVAHQAEQRVEWTEMLLENRKTSMGETRCYVLKGKIALPALPTEIQSYGDHSNRRDQYEAVEISLHEDGRVDYVAKSMPIHRVPQQVLAALKVKATQSPSHVYTVRHTMKGQADGYLFWLDEAGEVKYMVSHDGAKVDRF